MSEENVKNETENVEEMTVDQVVKILTFANAITANFPGIYGGGAWTPQTINAQMQNINYNPVVATQENIDAAMLDPRSNEKTLRGYSEYFYTASMPFKRIIEYLANMLAFDYTYTSDTDDYNSKAYKKDVKTITDFMTKFKAEKQFRMVTKQLLKEEIFYGCLWAEGDRYFIQQLPTDRCLLTGRFGYGFLFDFDMTWFLQPTVDIDLYPPIFKTMFMNTFHMNAKEAKERSKGEASYFYNPHIALNHRTENVFAQWCGCEPDLGFFVFKLSPEMASIVPFFSSMYSDLVLQPLMRGLQRNIFIAAASKLIVGEIPMLNKDTKALKISDMLALSPQELNIFMNLVKQAINSEVIKVAAAPLTNMETKSFDLVGDNSKVYNSYLKSALATSGINTSLIFTSDVKANVQESLLSLAVDEQLVESLYPQFNDFMDYYINMRTKNKFSFEFEGCRFPGDYEKKFQTQKDLLSLGICMPQKLASSLGMEYHNFLRMIEEGKAMGFVDKLTPIQTSFTMGKAGASTGGRPQVEDDKLSEGGESTRSTGQNTVEK